MFQEKRKIVNKVDKILNFEPLWNDKLIKKFTPLRALSSLY